MEGNRAGKPPAPVTVDNGQVEDARIRRRRNRIIMIGAGTAVAAVGAVGAVVAAPFVLAAAGFGTAGVVAGSIAAGVQSGIGSVAAGSIFASLQSAGVLGFAAATNAGIAVGGGAAGAGLGTGFSALFNKLKNRKRTNGSPPPPDNGTGNDDAGVEGSGTPGCARVDQGTQTEPDIFHESIHAAVAGNDVEESEKAIGEDEEEDLVETKGRISTSTQAP